MDLPLAAYPVDTTHLEAVAVYVETGLTDAICGLLPGELDAGPSSADIVWDILTIMARLAAHCRMADGSEPTATLLAELAQPAVPGAWGVLFLTLALWKADVRANSECNPIDAAVPLGTQFPTDQAVPTLLTTLLWLALACSKASGIPPGTLVRTLGAPS